MEPKACRDQIPLSTLSKLVTATVLGFIWIAAMSGGFGYIIYTFIRDDRRSEKKRKEELQKNKEQ